jgi:hypothetical protein
VITHGRCVAYINKNSVYAILYNLGHSATTSAHHRQARRHCFKYGVRDSFAQTRKEQSVGPPEQLFDLCLPQSTEQTHRAFAAKLMDHEHQLLSLWAFSSDPIVNLDTSFEKFSYGSDAVVEAFFPVQSPNRQQPEWSVVLKLSAAERSELIHGNGWPIHQNLGCWGTECFNSDPHVVRHAMDEVCNLEDALQSNTPLRVLEGLNLLGRTAATHGDLRVPVKLGKFIKVGGSDTGELKVGNLGVNRSNRRKSHSLAKSARLLLSPRHNSRKRCRPRCSTRWLKGHSR